MNIPWEKIFGNSNPVEIEIGPERGSFLLAMAAAHPDRNYFGIERSASRARRLAHALAKARLPNVRVLNADAACVVVTCVPPRSVHAYHVYFPDPWWKRRHHRRRLLTPPFVAVLRRTLAEGGRIHLVTDVVETFRLAVQVLGAVEDLVAESDPQPRPVRTAFETKALRQGSQLHAMTWRKSAMASTLAKDIARVAER